MYKSPLAKKLIDILGNQAISSQQKSWALLDVLHREAEPDKIADGIKIILECCGLSPRHESKLEAPSFEEALIERVEKANRAKVDHLLKGWFEINKDRPIEKTLIELCCFLEEFTDEKERAIVFQMILISKYIPIPVHYFSKHIAEPNDDLILREHAGEYIQMRQLLNLQVDATSRGSLLIDFITSLSEKPQAQAVVLGFFIEELLWRLQGRKGRPQVSQAQNSEKSSEPKVVIDNEDDSPAGNPNPFNFPPNGDFSAQFPFNSDMSPEQMKDMLNNFKSMLPPEVLEQLKKLFGDEPPKDL